MNYHFSHQAFAKLVRRLEEKEYIESIYYQNYKKYLFLTAKGLNEIGLDKIWPINKEIIQHDLISVNVLQYLLNEGDVFMGGKLMLDEAGMTNRPDGEVTFASVKKLAIEVELTQKESSRIENKFKEYYKSNSVSYVLYLFTRPSVFKAYKKIIDRMDKNINPLIGSRYSSKIILMIEPDIKNNLFSLKDSSCYFKQSIYPFKDIIKDQFH